VLRRGLLRTIVVGLPALTGCLARDGTTPGPGGSSASPDASTTTDASTAGAVTTTKATKTVGAAVEERVVECERAFIEDRLLSDEDESITDLSGPIVEATEARGDGAYIEVETRVGTVRSADGEPDEHVDYLVTAAYLVTDSETYRTEGFEADGDPRDGTPVDC
jgi:hypothetical protein